MAEAGPPRAAAAARDGAVERGASGAAHGCVSPRKGKHGLVPVPNGRRRRIHHVQLPRRDHGRLTHHHFGRFRSEAQTAARAPFLD